jgi:hypothetical protein
MVRRRCPQCKAPFHLCLYEQFSLQMAMSQHCEYNMFNTPNRPQAWGTNMKWIWDVGMLACLLLHGGIDIKNGNMTNP